MNTLSSTLLLSQSKSWVDNMINLENLVKFFHVSNHNDIVGEFLFLISNLYSSQDNDFKKSNFYLNLIKLFKSESLFLTQHL